MNKLQLPDWLNEKLSADQQNAMQDFIGGEIRQANAELSDALARFIKLCPSAEGLGGHAPMVAFDTAAHLGRAALAKGKPANRTHPTMTPEQWEQFELRR